MLNDFSHPASLAVSFFYKLKRLVPDSISLPQGNRPDTLRPPLSSKMKATLEKQRSQEMKILLNLENRLQVVDYVLDRHPSLKKEVKDLIREIRERDQDPRLYLGIIGEFNSGKSSFINALLRNPFLSISDKPATTCTPTVLTWAPKLEATVYFTNGREKSFSHFRSLWIALFQQLQAYSETAQSKCLRNFVHQYSSVTFGTNQSIEKSEKLAKEIYSVQVGYPSNTLKRGLLIIDTPGANAIQSHDELTGRIAQKFCDTCIILIPKETPASQSLLKFIKTYLKNILHHCIFVVHKTDQIPSRECEMFLKGVKATLQRELKETGVQELIVLPASSQMVIDDLKNSVDNKERRKKFVQEFERTEQQIYQTLAERKEIILAERMISCLDNLFQKLTEELNLSMREYQAKYEKIACLKIRNLEEFIKEQSQRQREELFASQYQIGQALKHNLEDMKESVQREISGLIQRAQSKSSLKEILQNQIPHRIQSSLSNGYRETLEDCRTKIKNLASPTLRVTGIKKIQTITRQNITEIFHVLPLYASFATVSDWQMCVFL